MAKLEPWNALRPLGSRELGAYVLSLPERALRSISALTGGLLRELGDVSVPPAVRKSRLYRTMVENTLRFLIEQVGQVEGAFPPEGRLARDFAVRRAAGNGIELLGILAFRASPVWVLAALADLSGAGRQVVREIAESLKEEGLLDREGRFETVDEMLDGLERISGRLAEALNTPPLDLAGLRREWADLQREARSIPPLYRPSAGRIGEFWARLRSEAAAQRRSVFELSSLMALASVTRLPENTIGLSRSARIAARRTGERLAGALLGHYEVTLQEIRETGLFAYWSREFRPYLRAAAEQFSPRRISATQTWLRRMGEETPRAPAGGPSRPQPRG